MTQIQLKAKYDKIMRAKTMCIYNYVSKKLITYESKWKSNFWNKIKFTDNSDVSAGYLYWG